MRRDNILLRRIRRHKNSPTSQDMCENFIRWISLTHSRQMHDNIPQPICIETVNACPENQHPTKHTQYELQI